MLDKELHNLLKENGEALDRVAKAHWLLFMATQEQMTNRTPTSTSWGSYGFNPSNSATYPAAWRQLVPRNDRRKRIRFTATPTSGGYQSLYFSNSDINLDIGSLIELNNSGSFGYNGVALITFSPSTIFELDTTDAIWCASISGSGSTKEETGVINWAEDIYSAVTAIPTYMDNIRTDKPGDVEKLTPGAMQLDGDIRATFTREGVR